MPAGFYYKTFMWPKSLWMKYEHYIRKASGLGTAPTEPDPDRYDRMNAHCDVLVVGGGPAGLAAAWAAGSAGARVILADEQNELGGSLLSQREVASVAADPASEGTIGGGSPMAWVTRTVARLATMPDVRLMPRSTVFGYHDHNFLTIAERLTDHLPPAERSGAARAHLARAREAGGARDRRDGAAARLREQRPSRRDAGLRGVRLRQPLRRAARHAGRRVHQQRQRVPDGAAPRRRRHRSGGGRRSRAPRRAASCPSACARPASR